MKAKGVFCFVVAIATLLVGCKTGTENITDPDTAALSSEVCTEEILERFLQMPAGDSSYIYELTEKLYTSQIGCGIVLCENSSWRIDVGEKSNHCIVSLSLEVSGREESVPMYLINADDDKLYAVDSPLNLGKPAEMMYLAFDSTEEQVLPPLKEN